MSAPPKDDLPFMSLSGAGRTVGEGSVSPTDLMKSVLVRIEREEQVINSFIKLRDEALSEAETATGLLRAGKRIGPLHGLPIALKDLFETTDHSTTFGSRHFDGKTKRDAAVVTALKSAGAIIVGYNNLDEFAFGSFNANEHFGQTLNPWDIKRTPGGSSGGSAAAVAAGFALAAIGTDTGVSIRQPAAFCNLVGLKPTFGLIDAQGAQPFSTSLDHIGPITRTVEDSAILLSVLASSDSPEMATYTPLPNLKGIRIGIPDTYFLEDCEADVWKTVQSAIQLLCELGASFKTLSFPFWTELNSVAAIICRAEAGCFHRSAYKKRPQTFGSNMQAFLAEALEISAVDYIAACARKAEITARYENSTVGLDAVVTPTSPQAPALIEEGPELNQGLRWRYTGPFAALGVPAVSVPCGFSRDGLPVGLHFAGQRFRDIELLNITAAYEAATGCHLRRPGF